MTFGVGQTQAWIIGEGPINGGFIATTPTINFEIQLTREELARYPKLKAYIDYLDIVRGISSQGARSIDPTARAK